MFYNNIQLLIPIIITITVTVICIAFTVVCYKYREYIVLFCLGYHGTEPPRYLSPGQRGRERKDTMDGTNQQSADAQRDRYYATIHKVALQAGDKIPGKIATNTKLSLTQCLLRLLSPVVETSEDISPYATFQLSEASTLAQPHHSGPTNTLLHSFMYHERAMTEGCASPPPAAVLRQLHNQSPYYNIVRLIDLLSFQQSESTTQWGSGQGAAQHTSIKLRCASFFSQ